MKNRVTLSIAALLTLTPLAGAQTGATQPGQSQPGGRNPAFAATFDLVREVNGLTELNKDPKTAINRAQAQKLLPILRGLQTAKTLPPAAATKILTQMEAVLTDPQLSALDALALKRQAGGPGRFGPGGQGGPGGGRPGSQGGNGQGSARPARIPGMNPFLRGRGVQSLSALITTLGQTSK